MDWLAGIGRAEGGGALLIGREELYRRPSSPSFRQVILAKLCSFFMTWSVDNRAVGHGVATDAVVVNVVGAEQSQELFEVGW